METALQIATKQKGTWVQTERAAHEKWARLAMSNPRASALLHVLISKMGRHNAIVASLPNLMRLMGCSRNTVIRAISTLKEQNWLEVRQIGAAGTTNVYIVNDRVAWSGLRDGIRYSLFSASVLISDDEQQDRAQLGEQPPLITIPELYPNERQLPSGEGLPPPSQPSFEGLEPELPARIIGEHQPDEE